MADSDDMDVSVPPQDWSMLPNSTSPVKSAPIKAFLSSLPPEDLSIVLESFVDQLTAEAGALQAKLATCKSLLVNSLKYKFLKYKADEIHLKQVKQHFSKNEHAELKRYVRFSIDSLMHLLQSHVNEDRSSFMSWVQGTMAKELRLSNVSAR
jgi:hypothetical protein